MKKTVFLFTSLLILLTGCATTKINIQENSPCALMSVMCNPYIQWIEVQEGREVITGSGLLNKVIIERYKSENPEFSGQQDRINFADETVRKLLPETIGFEFLDKDTLLNSKAYSMINESIFNTFSDYITADNYKNLSTVHQSISRSLYKKTGAKSALFLNFGFYKKVIRGTKHKGAVAPVVTMRVILLGPNGRESIYKTLKVTGLKEIEISENSYDVEELVNCYPEIIENLINQLCLYLM